MPIRTHYDNLHITPDASAEEIRQAYRRLSKQYHPDLNQDPDAHRVMQLINQAYETLSNPETRAEHDRWIAAQRAAKTPTTVQIIVPPVAPQTPVTPVTPRQTAPKNHKTTLAIIIASLIALGLLGWQIAQLFQQKFINKTTTPTTAQKEHISVNQNGVSPPMLTAPDVATTLSGSHPNTASAPYIRPHAAPNGNPWPNDSSYLDGYAIQYGQGSNQLTVDNVRNPSDVYAELTQEGKDQPLRHFFIKERSYLILDKLDAGAYTIRYRQLDAGEELLSEHVQIGGKEKEATIYLQRGKAPE
ncbi:J domain-containing protein [Neisseriaceae bacterium B1]